MAIGDAVQPHDLNDVDAIGFPHPVMINGMAVIEISTTIGYLRLAEDYHFIHKGQKTVCPKNSVPKNTLFGC